MSLYASITALTVAGHASPATVTAAQYMSSGWLPVSADGVLVDVRAGVVDDTAIAESAAILYLPAGAIGPAAVRLVVGEKKYVVLEQRRIDNADVYKLQNVVERGG